MKITSKYVLREHLGPLTFALGALTSLLLLNYIARKFGDLVGRGLPWTVIAKFFYLSVPFTIAMTLPMAVLVSVLYAFSRLASENEITAFKASGVSMGRLLGPVLWAATVVAVGMVLFNDQVLSRANHTLSTLQQDIARTTPTFVLKEQVLNEIGSESFLMRAAHIDPARNTMKEVTIYDMTQSAPRTIRADSGALGLMPNGKDLQLTLFTGSIDQLNDGKPDQLQRMFFDTQLVRVRDVVKAFDPTKAGQNDYKSDREMSICELQRAYIRARTEYMQARLDYDIAKADSLKRPHPKGLPKRKVFLGIGRLYCQAIQSLAQLGVRSLQAQQPPAAQPPATQPPATQPARPDTLKPDTTRRDTTRRDTTRRDTTRRDTAVTPAPATPAQTPVPPMTQPPPLPVPTATPIVPAPNAAIPPSTVPPATVPPATVPPSTVPPPPSGAGPSPLAMSSLALARLRLGETLGSMNNYDVEIHKKFALAVACIVFVLLGAPVALRFPRGGVGLVIGVSLFVFAAYYSFLIAGEELASRGMLPPWIAMWAANVLFTLVALPLVLRMGRIGGSNRGGGIGEWLDAVRFRMRRRRRAAASSSSSPARA
ncbi:permease YjgP/YjgQ family protein [Gemmatirosa kalamazoonensis]|uniref:Permease YjgP/YjgQ family protein n=1 Tax=Gemmatirosa kalamazoonensis TaxID=861299 RepID=W0RKW5_9BACT|nr:LptF/LptG family permease [Gemmatirosa kalamazoonensis]AHG91699.1 permease YjgP/YjgQ family protein [Gemmatirosa kalamazoonensis]